MLVVSRVFPKVYDDDNSKPERKLKPKITLARIENRTHKGKTCKTSLMNNMMVIQKVKFVVDPEIFYPLYKHYVNKEKYSFFSRSKEKPRRLREIEKKVILINKEEANIKFPVENLPNSNIKAKLPSIKTFDDKVSKFPKIQIKEEMMKKNNSIYSERVKSFFSFQNSLRQSKEGEGSSSPRNKGKFNLVIYFLYISL